MSRLTCAAGALTLLFALAPLSASALDYNCCDRNKDGMVSKQEYLDEMGRRYDAAMAKMKAMPAADQARMIKGNQMTAAGFDQFLQSGALR
jgi:hypothetical protein